MSVQIVRFRIAPERSAAVSAQIESLFAAVHDAAPENMQYIASREADDSVFTLILELPEGAENPLPSIPAAADFRSWLLTQTDDDTMPRPYVVVGRYEA